MKLIALLALASLASAAPTERDAKHRTSIQPVLLNLENEPDTPMKVISLAATNYGVFASDNAVLRFAYLDATRPTIASILVRIVRPFKMDHARLNFSLVAGDDQQSESNWVYNLDKLCPQEGVGHKYTCTKESSERTMSEIVFPTNWNVDMFKNRLAIMWIKMVSDDEEVLFNTRIYVELV